MFVKSKGKAASWCSGLCQGWYASHRVQGRHGQGKLEENVQRSESKGTFRVWLLKYLFVYPSIQVNICIKRKTSFIALYAQPDINSNQCHSGKEKSSVLCTLPVF